MVLIVSSPDPDPRKTRAGEAMYSPDGKVLPWTVGNGPSNLSRPA